MLLDRNERPELKVIDRLGVVFHKDFGEQRVVSTIWQIIMDQGCDP